MRRLALAFLTLVLVAAAAWAAWRWWTAPPAAIGTEMAAAAAFAPDNADGILVLAEPRRAARWLVQHPQALGLLPIVTPAANRAVAALEPAVRAVAEEAQGPLVIWWKGDAAAVAADTGPRAAPGLRRVAELRGLTFAEGPMVVRGVTATGPRWPEFGHVEMDVRLATAAALLDESRPASPPPPSAGRLALLTRVRGRWWTGSATRATLMLRQGVAPELPALAPASRLETADATAFGALFDLPAEPFRGSACLAFSAEHGWAVALPTAAWPSALRTALGGRWPQAARGAVTGAERWQGLAGELLVLPRFGVTAASDPAMLAAVASCDPRRDQGCLAGADLAWVATRIASAADRLAPLVPRLGRLRQAAPLLAGLAHVRWRFAGDGAVILLEW